MHVLGVTGDVEYPEQLSLRRENRRRGAAEDGVGIQVVFPALHQHRPVLHQGGTDSVGAPCRFTPLHPGLQEDLLRLLQKTETAGGVENQSRVIGQQHQAFAVGDQLRQGVHLGLGQPAQAGHLFLTFVQQCAVNAMGRVDPAVVEPRGAALPGAGDDFRYPARRVLPLFEKQGARGFRVGSQGLVFAHRLALSAPEPGVARRRECRILRQLTG